MRPTQTTRRNDIDALRVLAFGLLILYHVGMFYVSWDWHVKSRYQFDWLEPAMSLVNQWRMPLIFMISGLAVNFLLGEGGRQRLGYRAFAWQRTVRLGVPLLFGMLVIVPPQAYFEALENGAIEPGYLAFLWRYFTFQAWPEGAFDGSDYGLTWNHLWYLPYLLTYSLLLIPVAAFLEGPGRKLRERLCRLRGIWLWLLPILPLMAWGQWIFPHFPYIRHDLITDGYAHALFGTFFLYGFVIGRDVGLWRELAALRWYTLAVALVTYLLLTAYREVLPDEPGALADTAFMAVIYLNRWTWLLLVLGWGHRLLNREFSWLPYARSAVYPWYVLHQTITVVAGYGLTRLALGPVVEPLLLLAATFGGCALIHHFVVRRSGRFGLLFGYTAVAPGQSRRGAGTGVPAADMRSS